MKKVLIYVIHAIVNKQIPDTQMFEIFEVFDAFQQAIKYLPVILLVLVFLFMGKFKNYLTSLRAVNYLYNYH